VRILQGPQRGTRWIVGSTNHGAWLGTYELPKQERFAASLRPGMTVWDIGANVGVYTLLAARCVARGGRVTAFEPLPANVNLLKRHIELNDVGNVTVVEKAVSDADGHFSFQSGQSRAQGRLGVGAGGTQVETVRLDTYWHSSGECPDVVKMDIEGSEFHALSGARNCLAACRPQVFLATHGASVHGQCVQLLHEIGYDIFALKPDEGVNQTDELVAVWRTETRGNVDF
jgi:FkbM family methyltransferase